MAKREVYIGQMDRVLTWLTPIYYKQSSGSVNENWVAVKDVFGQLKARNGVESERNEKETALNNVQLITHYDLGYSEDQILVDGARDYRVTSIFEIDGTRDKFLKFTAQTDDSRNPRTQIELTGSTKTDAAVSITNADKGLRLDYSGVVDSVFTLGLVGSVDSDFVVMVNNLTGLNVTLTDGFTINETLTRGMWAVVYVSRGSYKITGVWQ